MGVGACLWEGGEGEGVWELGGELMVYGGKLSWGINVEFMDITRELLTAIIVICL